MPKSPLPSRSQRTKQSNALREKNAQPMLDLIFENASSSTQIQAWHLAPFESFLCSYETPCWKRTTALSEPQALNYYREPYNRDVTCTRCGKTGTISENPDFTKHTKRSTRAIEETESD